MQQKNNDDWRRDYESKQQSRNLAVTVVWFVFILVMATIAGAWLKLYWLGWVTAGL